jgi:hypothetical protein
MYTRTITVIERSDVASILFYRWKEGAYFVTFTNCETIYTFTGKYSGGENVEGRLYKFKKGGSMDLIGVASMNGSVMNEILTMWNKHIKEIEKNA